MPEQLTNTILSKLGAFAKKYSIVIALITYFGIDKGAMQFFKDADAAMKNPKEMQEKYSRDSTLFVNTIHTIDMQVKSQAQEIKMLEDKVLHLSVGLSIATDCFKEELDIATIWDQKVYKTNPGNMWIFRADKYEIRTPLSLQPDWHERQFFYQPIGSTTKIKLK